MSCLLESVQGLLERTYRMETGLRDIGRFVIGDRGLRALYAEQPATRTVPTAGGLGARTLVRDTGNGVRACIYFPDEQIRRLERYPPQRGVGDENVAAFATLVEELDHLLVLAERTRHRRPVSLFELELHANVSKHLVLARFLAGARRVLGPAERLWLRGWLFGAEEYSDPRYVDAARWAVRFLDALPRLRAAERLDALRRFHDADGRGKVRVISTLAAA